MILGNHRELWVDNEFPILNIVDGLKKEDKDVSDLYKQSAGIELELTSEDLVLSEDEEGNKMRKRQQSIKDNLLKSKMATVTLNHIRSFMDGLVMKL